MPDAAVPRRGAIPWLVALIVAVLAGVLALAAVPAVAGTAPQPQLTPQRPVPAWSPPTLSRQGRWLVDPQGRVVVLHGENMVSKYAPYTYSALGFGPDDVRFLRAQGIDAIRLGVIWKALEPKPGVYDEQYLSQVAATVRMAERNGLLVLLEFHQDQLNEAFKGEGFPDWAIRPANLARRAGVRFLSLGQSLGWADFMANRPVIKGLGVQDYLAAAWQHVAEKFRSDRSIIFEPLNEPYPTAPVDLALGCLQPLGCPTSDVHRLRPLYLKLLAAIRRADRTRLVFFEPWFSFDYDARSWLPKFDDAHVGFAPHVYCPTGAAGIVPLKGTGCSILYRLGFANIAFHEKRTGEPTMITEFGAGSSEAEHNTVESLADKQMIGWFHWAYWAQDNGEPQTYALLANIHRGPVKGNVSLGQLDAITRPYPRRIAGTPQSWAFDPDTGRFTLDYRTAPVGGGRFPAGARTEVVLPSGHYPNGYGATVRGGRVVSAPDAALLQIEACGSAGSVSVEVSPGGANHSTC